jgi:hypothetical protein
MGAQARAIPMGGLWNPVETFIDGNYLTAHAWRSFEQDSDELDWKMGQNKNWAIGFFDM